MQSEEFSGDDIRELLKMIVGKVFVFEYYNSYTTMTTRRIELEMVTAGSELSVNISESDFGTGGFSDPVITGKKNIRADIEGIVNGKIKIVFTEKYSSGIGDVVFLQPDKNEFTFVE